MTTAAERASAQTDAAVEQAHAVAARARRTAEEADGARVDERAIAALEQDLQAACAGLRARIAGDRALVRDPARVATVCDLLIELSDRQQDLREAVLAGRFDVLGRVHAGLTRLRRLSDVEELLRAAPHELCRCCDFDRALVSRVDGRSWMPHTWAIAPAADAVVAEEVEEFFTGRRITLTPALIETEVARRSAPALVADTRDARAHPPLVQVSGTRAYVTAPLLQGRRVFGLLHADTYISERPLTAVDRDNLWTFAEGFGRVFERVVLLQGLAGEREHIERAFRSAARDIERLCNAELKLERLDRLPDPAGPAGTALMTLTSSPITRLFTARERDVLELMISGARNSSIAGELVISEGTVKSHVKNICRKLRVSSRAEAISKYLQILARTSA